MNLIESCTNTLASAIRKGAVYKDYEKALKELEEFPDLKKRVDELRLLNYKMQEDSHIDLYKAIGQINSLYDELCKIPQVQKFLEAELALCKQLKKISATIYQGINLDVPPDL